ncbi:ATP-grasp domain-containing protein [Candidatus Thioglobus sp.]|nr:ATP-grasp domain-containing protein [Candidatus Thioglobus sp.]MDC1165318.1 ATP-grasp domain-containing protein [Candidatus Thioglobus sp.]
MPDTRCILFIGGGIETLPGVLLAKSMGLYVVVSDANSNAPCMSEADDSLIASTYDIDESIAVARKYNNEVHLIDGVMCLATDVPLTVASVAAELCLPGIPIDAARIVTDKLAMKDYLVSCGVPMPWYAPVKSVDALKNIISERGYSLVIKPTDSRGARGVLMLKPDIDLEWAFSVAQSFSPSDQVMVEEFLDGPQISTESLIVNGEVYTIGFSDRNYEFLSRYAPHIIENGGDLPSFLNEADQQSISDAVTKTAKSLKIENGVIKGDMVLSKGKPYVIEVALRLSGGYFCTHEIPLNTGVDFVGNAIRLALGDTVAHDELTLKFKHMVCQRYMFPEPGLVERIYIPDWISEDPDIALFEVRVKPGDIVPTTEHHPSRAGVVIATGKDRKDARERAERAILETKISTIPE